MLFADVSLAGRIEAAECTLLRESAAAVARRRAGVVDARPFAGGIAVYAGEGSPLNKIAGIGFAGPLDLAELEAVERSFAAVGSPVQVELSCLAQAGIAAALTARGYRLFGFENVLGMRLPPPRPSLPPGPAIEVARSELGELGTWLDVVATGFATPDTQGVASHETFSREAVEQVMSDLATAGRLVRYLARLHGVPAGGASMLTADGVCLLCGAATLPQHRRRGVQSAMLERRLADAVRADCEVATVTTLPGSKSQQNVQRLGFQLLYTRAILVREA